jgi:hypothetical protein
VLSKPRLLFVSCPILTPKNTTCLRLLYLFCKADYRVESCVRIPSRVTNPAVNLPTFRNTITKDMLSLRVFTPEPYSSSYDQNNPNPYPISPPMFKSQQTPPTRQDTYLYHQPNLFSHPLAERQPRQDVKGRIVHDIHFLHVLPDPSTLRDVGSRNKYWTEAGRRV